MISFWFLSRDELKHIKQIIDFFFDNSCLSIDPKKTCCRICIEGIRVLGDHVLYFDLRNDEYLYFNIYRVDVKPPRIYINSHSKAYDLIRKIALPNISYIAILKLKNQDDIIYYFRPFIEYNVDSLQKEEIKNIENDANITTPERETIIKSRIGQGKYREELLKECPYCPITMVNDERLLIASHIKPWVESNNFEKTDSKNGFMFTPTYDKLFDRGFISFENDGTMLVSPWISPMNQKRLNIFNGKKIKMLPTEGREAYLFYHRESVFKK